MAEAEISEVTSTSEILQEIFTSPLNLTLLSLCLFLVYKILRGDKQPDFGEVEKPLPKLKKRDFTLEELKPYDGLQNERILMAVKGKVFDVTRGKKFYGPGMALLHLASRKSQKLNMYASCLYHVASVKQQLLQNRTGLSVFFCVIL